MLTGENKIHVARNGSLVGMYDADQLVDLLERGQLQKTDHFFDEAKGEWVLLSEWKEAPGLGEFKPAEPKPPSEDGRKSGRDGKRRGGKSSRSKKDVHSALAGWVACLFALGVAAGIWAYAATLLEKLRLAEDEIKVLQAAKASLQRENQLMTEITPSERVRAIITYEPSSNQVAIMSGATIGLYRRADVEAALTRSMDDVGALSSAEAFEAGIERLKSSIASPLQITLTDSNGRVDLPVAEPGEYVLVASAGKSTGGGTERYLWLIGFRASDQPSSLILMNEHNAISLRKPSFKITHVPAMVSGLETPGGSAP